MIKLVSAVIAMFVIVLPAGTAYARQSGYHGSSAVVPITQYQTVYNHNQGNHSGDWTICGYVTKASYTQTASCNQTVSVSTTITGNIGYSISKISASVGFSVSHTTSVSQGFTTGVTVKPGGFGDYDAGIYYDQHEIGLRHRTCNPNTGTCGPWSRVDNITVQRFITTTGHYFGTKAA
jgi:hypothetical protein